MSGASGLRKRADGIIVYGGGAELRSKLRQTMSGAGVVQFLVGEGYAIAEPIHIRQR